MIFNVSAVDPEGECVNLEAFNLPEGAAFDEAAGVFSWRPRPWQLGTHQVTFEATDESDDDEQPSGKPAKASKPTSDEAPDNLAVAADAGLNGAQIQAALSVIEQIVAGRMPAKAGVELLISLGLDAATVEKMMSAIKTFKPKKDAEV